MKKKKSTTTATKRGHGETLLRRPFPFPGTFKPPEFHRESFFRIVFTPPPLGWPSFCFFILFFRGVMTFSAFTRSILYQIPLEHFGFNSCRGSIVPSGGLNSPNERSAECRTDGRTEAQFCWSAPPRCSQPDEEAETLAD